MTEENKNTAPQSPRKTSALLVDVRNGAIILASLAFAFHWAMKGDVKSAKEIDETMMSQQALAKLNAVVVPTPASKDAATADQQSEEEQIARLVRERAREVDASKSVILKSRREKELSPLHAQAPVQAPAQPQVAPTQAGQQGIAFPKVGYRADGSRMTKEEEAEQIKAATQKIPDEYTIFWKAPDEKVKIFVFTDPTCPYCKKLHESIPKLNAAGISVHYLMYARDIPRYTTPEQSPTVKNLANVWCSLDQQAAMNDAYDGYRVKDASCSDLPADIKRIRPPVVDHFTLGELFSVKGTPTVLVSNGKKFEGFGTAEQLIQNIFAE